MVLFKTEPWTISKVKNMKTEAAVTALITLLTSDSALPIYLLFVIPVLSILLAGLVIYAVYWKQPK